jgi:hypothetical protein
VPPEVLGWPTDVNTCPCQDCADIADEFAAIADNLAADFQHIDIRRLSALYLTPGRRD